MPAMLTARPRQTLLFALVLAAASLTAVPARAGEAQDQFDKGNAAFEAEKYEEALAAYQAAWKLTKSHDLAFMMGRAEMELGKLKEAAEHFTYALAHFPLTGDQELRENVETSLAQVKTKVGTVKIKSQTKDVAITIDGVKVEPSALDSDIFLSPGKHAIEATAPGYRPMRRALDFKGGEEEQVTMNLTLDGGGGSGAPRNPIPGFGMVGLGVVGVVMGGVLIGLAEGKKGEATALHDEIGSAAGCQAQPDKCQELRDATSTADGLGNGGIGALVFGGLFGAAGAAYLLIPSRKSGGAPSTPPPTAPLPEKKPALTFLPVAGLNTGGFVLSGSF